MNSPTPSAPPDEFSSVVELLRWRAVHQPQRRAYTFLVDGESQAVHLTYSDLERWARGIATQLREVCAPGDRAVLLYPPGLEYIAALFGCLWAEVVAVPAYPPRLNRPLPRLQAILADAQATVALTTPSILSNLEHRLAGTPGLPPIHWLTTDNPTEAAQDREPASLAINRETLALLQYTSGSTASPKGVQLTHANLLHNLGLIYHCFEHTPESRGVIWLPPYHDMGLIGGLLQPLYGGFPVTLMSPVAFLQRPVRWLQAISRTRATTSGGPDFAYALCVDKISPEERQNLDLSSWTVAFNGAEPIRAETLERFVDAFAPCGFRREAFYPCYGLAEATLLAAGGLKSAGPVVYAVDPAALEAGGAAPAQEASNSRRLVGCGQTLPDQSLIIVDPIRHQVCSPNQVGEIWVSSPSVSPGYWNRAGETQEVFQARLGPAESRSYLRTGDLGFLREGELFVTGRLKDLIILRGRNHYPQDIELTVERSYPGLRPGCSAAFSVDVEGEERLVVVQEVERHPRHLDLEEAARAIRQAVAEQHEVQIYAVSLIKTGSIPKTSSGKIQRYACRQAFLANTLEALGTSLREETVTDWGEASPVTREALLAIEPEARQPLLEFYLRQQAARVLKLNPAQLDLQQPLSALGLDSLAAVELQHQVETHLGVVLPMALLLQDLGLAQLASHLNTGLAVPEPESLVAAGEIEAEYPLSAGQRGIWFLYRLAPESAAYHIASAVKISGDLDRSALRQAFQSLVDRHPALRTTFSAPGGQPVQRIHPRAEIYFQETEASAWAEADLNDRLIQEAHRPFNLEEGPLLRVHLFARSAQEHILLLVMHHIVTDFWSLAVLMHELGLSYAALRSGAPTSLPPPAWRYRDYVRWQTEMLAGVEGERLWTFWHEQLAGELPVMNLPADRPRPSLQSYRGASYRFPLDESLTRQLKALARSKGTTLYTVLLAAFQVLLHRTTGQEDILVGSPTSGRSRAGLAEVVGYFANPIVHRADFSVDLTFAAFLEQARQKVLAGFEHQDYPLATFVERLQPERDASHSPVFQVMFIFQKAHLDSAQGLAALALGESGTTLTVGGLQLESLALERQAAQFDLTLMMAESQGGLLASLKYSTDLFDPPTVKWMSGHFETLLQGIAADPEQRLSRLPLLTETERQQLLIEWNGAESPGSRFDGVHKMIEAQVERTPDAIALVGPSLPSEDAGCQLTYGALNDRANRLAHYLCTLGVGPEVPVGLCVERSVEMLVGMLGILKAGGAYVPLDPEYPPERLEFMLEDSQTRVLLTQSKRLAAGGWPLATTNSRRLSLICLDTNWETITSRQPPTANCQPPAPDSLAYLIYTSGSTGVPKGVMITHANLCPYIEVLSSALDIQATDRQLLLASFAFAASVRQYLLPLSTGGAVVIASTPQVADPRALFALLQQEAVTLLAVSPSYWRNAIDVLSHLDAETRTTLLKNQLRLIVSASEPLPADVPNDWAVELKHGARLVNMFGQTELTGIVATYPIPSPEAIPGNTVPVGRPLPGVQIYLLDRNLQPVPVRVPGEVYVAGSFLARGYFHGAELTAEKFIPNPFLQKDEGGRMKDESGKEDSFILHPSSLILYKTGDLACYLPDGTLQHLGRADDQVKIRGFRVELGEIETVLRRHPAVKECVVIAREDVPGAKRLVAYLVLKSGVTTPLVNEWRNYLLEHLPQPLVPAAFVSLEKLPVTPNGKVDRRALPAPDQARPALPEEFGAPRNALEGVLADLWAQMLGLESVGIYDNFFELGGHSLMATQLIAQLQELFPTEELLLSIFFENPTIAGLAEALAQSPGGQGEAGVVRLLERLEQLSDEELQAMLDGTAGGVD